MSIPPMWKTPLNLVASNMPKQFLMLDGMTGSGKTTILKEVQTWAEQNYESVFKLQEWKDVAPPTFKQIPDYDIYFTFEPTKTWIGAAIRYELSRTDNPYGGMELAHAFALDRQLMYKRLILPALEAGKIIIQDRGVSSSIIYQPIMPRGAALTELLNLPGNQLALQHAPDALILTKLDAETAHQRIQKRDDESKGVFAELAFMKQQQERFASDWFHKLFEDQGSTVHQIDTSTTIEETKNQTLSLIQQLLKTS